MIITINLQAIWWLYIFLTWWLYRTLYYQGYYNIKFIQIWPKFDNFFFSERPGSEQQQRTRVQPYQQPVAHLDLILPAPYQLTPAGSHMEAWGSLLQQPLSLLLPQTKVQTWFLFQVQQHVTDQSASCLLHSTMCLAFPQWNSTGPAHPHDPQGMHGQIQKNTLWSQPAADLPRMGEHHFAEGNVSFTARSTILKEPH